MFSGRDIYKQLPVDIQTFRKVDKRLGWLLKWNRKWFLQSAVLYLFQFIPDSMSWLLLSIHGDVARQNGGILDKKGLKRGRCDYLLLCSLLIGPWVLCLVIFPGRQGSGETSRLRYRDSVAIPVTLLCISDFISVCLPISKHMWLMNLMICLQTTWSMDIDGISMGWLDVSDPRDWSVWGPIL